MIKRKVKIHVYDFKYSFLNSLAVSIFLKIVNKKWFRAPVTLNSLMLMQHQYVDRKKTTVRTLRSDIPSSSGEPTQGVHV